MSAPGQASVSLVATELSMAHQAELVREVKRGLVELAPGSGQPADIIKALERAVFFLRQRQLTEGLASVSDQVARLGFVWADQLRREYQWKWLSVSTDGSLNPAVASAELTWACDPVGLMLDVVERHQARVLTQLYERIGRGELPTPAALSWLSPATL